MESEKINLENQSSIKNIDYNFYKINPNYKTITFKIPKDFYESIAIFETIESFKDICYFILDGDEKEFVITLRIKPDKIEELKKEYDIDNDFELLVYSMFQFLSFLFGINYKIIFKDQIKELMNEM